jgi:Na+/melibiose symporter-like transporter
MPRNKQDEPQKENVIKNENNIEYQHLELKVQIEEAKFRYKIERRPLSWFWIALIFDIIILVAAIIAIYIFGGDSYVGGWSIFIAIVNVLIFIYMCWLFFSNESDFKGVERIQKLLSSKEEIERLQIQLRILEEFRSNSRSPKEKYADEISNTIKQYIDRANRNRNFYYTLQIIIILCSLLVSGLTSGLTNLIPIFNNKWIAPIISLLVSF